jgi:hypothetical protein
VCACYCLKFDYLRKDFTACELLDDSRNYIPGRIRRVKTVWQGYDLWKTGG